jgi:WD40 repeat protein
MRPAALLTFTGLLLPLIATAQTKLRMISIDSSAVLAAFSRYGKEIAVASRDNKVRFYSLPAGEPLRTIQLDRQDVNDMGFSQDAKKFFIAGTNGSVTVWDTATVE